MLRHTYASTQLQAGVSVRAVAKWLGHADGGALLLRTYAHVMPQAHEQGGRRWTRSSGPVSQM